MLYLNGAVTYAYYETEGDNHRRQARGGCRGRIPTNILVGGDINGNVPTIG